MDQRQHQQQPSLCVCFTLGLYSLSFPSYFQLCPLSVWLYFFPYLFISDIFMFRLFPISYSFLYSSFCSLFNSLMSHLVSSSLLLYFLLYTPHFTCYCFLPFVPAFVFISCWLYFYTSAFCFFVNLKFPSSKTSMPMTEVTLAEASS